MTNLLSLMRYKRWANDLLFAATKELSVTELFAPRQIVFGSIIHTLNHTYAMDQVWQAHLRGKDHGYSTRKPDNCPSLEELCESQRLIDNWFIDYAEALDNTEHDDLIEFTFIGGGEGVMSRAEILIHVMNHGTYHRGNVTSIMYDCSVLPPTTDYPVFLRSQHAKAD